MPKHKETRRSEAHSGIEDILQELALGMVNLQKTVGILADNLQQSNLKQALILPNPISQDKSYILHWRELGGSNLSFYPNNKTHPMQFLKKLSKTLEGAGVPEESKINLSVNCLKGTAADWVATKETSFKNYDDFKKAFEDRYWGLEKQRELYWEIKYGRYRSGNYSDYFLDLINQANFLSNKIPDEELVDKISKHFPMEIRRGLVMQGLQTIESVEEYLRKLDETYIEEQRDNNSHSRNYNRNFRQNENGESASRGNNTRNINLITYFNQNQENWLVESDYEDEDINKNATLVPVIASKIGSEHVEILIDSGSEVSAISERLFEKIKLNLCVPVLPVTNVSISVAVGGKVQRVKYQTLLPIIINNEFTFDCICLVIPHLNRDMLLGCDFLSKHKVHLDFEKLRFIVNIEERIYSSDFICQVGKGKELQVNICQEQNIREICSNKIEINNDKQGYDDTVDLRISMDVERVRAINDFPVPRNLKNLRGFLGLVNYEQRFCKNYADLTIPLLKLLKKGVKWIWGVEQEKAFAKIKEAYLDVTILAHPNLDETFYIQCNSSDYGLGGCLYQLDRETSDRLVVAYTSRTLKGSELNYTVSEKETLAIVHCCRQWRTLILGRRLIIMTDHKSLTFLLKCNLRSAKANAKRDPITFEEGARVLVKTHHQSSAEEHTIRKFFLLYEGPYYVLQQLGPNSYLIGDELGRAIAKQNVMNLKLYKMPMVECN